MTGKVEMRGPTRAPSQSTTRNVVVCRSALVCLKIWKLHFLLQAFYFDKIKLENFLFMHKTKDLERSYLLQTHFILIFLTFLSTYTYTTISYRYLRHGIFPKVSSMENYSQSLFLYVLCRTSPYLLFDIIIHGCCQGWKIVQYIQR